MMMVVMITEASGIWTRRGESNNNSICSKMLVPSGMEKYELEITDHKESPIAAPTKFAWRRAETTIYIPGQTPGKG